MSIRFSASLPVSEHLAFEKSLTEYPPRCIRLRPGIISESLPFETQGVPWNKVGRIVADAELRPSQFLQYAVADYYIQDAGSLLALALADVQPSDAVCDLCAAPGGKASGVLELLSGDGFLLANEVISSRVPVLRYNLSRTWNPKYVVTNSDPSDLAMKTLESFDVVIVDAPCSGQSLTQKQKRGENAFDAKHIEHAAARQRRILRDALRLLKVGGRLVYSTCTFADEENEQQIRELIENYPVAAYPDAALAQWESPLLEACYRLWPHRDPTAGAFAARLRKLDSIEDVTEDEQSKRSKKFAGKTSRRESSKEKTSSMVEFANFQNLQMIDSLRSVHGICAASAARILSMLSKDQVHLSQLPELASRSKDVLTPAHEAAMFSQRYLEDFNILELQEREATALISGAALQRHDISDLQVQQNRESKFYLAQWNAKPLGWVKLAGNRWNNLIPSIARVSITDYP